MRSIEELRVRLQGKRPDSKEDEEKIDCLRVLFSDDNIFFRIDMDTALGILDYLGIDEDELLDYYFALISSENYLKMSRNYVSIKDDIR